MWKKFKRWLDAGVPIANPIERRQAPMLQISFMTLFAVLFLLTPLIFRQPTLAQRIVDGMGFLLILLSIAIALLVLRRAHFQAAIALFSTTFLTYIGSRLIILGADRNNRRMAERAPEAWQRAALIGGDEGLNHRIQVRFTNVMLISPGQMPAFKRP